MTDVGEAISGKMRLFAALPVPAEPAAVFAALPRNSLSGRWNHPGDLHITLRFLGDLPPEREPAIREALARVRRPPFHIEAAGLGVFENRRQTVLYVRVGSTRKLTALCAEITDALTPLAFDFGTRPFVPHITIARLKNSHGVSQYIEKYDKSVIGRWQAHSFSLMQSAGPDSTGAHYRTLAGYPLVS